MKNLRKILWGIALVALGVIWGVNTLGIADINIFFKGWWTLFIIIPSLTGLISNGNKSGDLFTLLVGVGLLLASQGVFSFSLFWKLLIPALIVIIGLRIIFRSIFKKARKDVSIPPRAKGGKMQFVLFSGADLEYSGQVFDGADYTAIFGGIDAHIESAVIDRDITVNAVAIFGGIDLYLPEGVNVEVSSASIFGGVSNERKREKIEGAPTVYVNASGIFGGVDVL